MEKLNELLNQALGKKNENYINKEGMKKCKDILEKLSKTDEPALKLFLYLYPIYSPLIEEEKFWFIKFKNDNEYDEYDFALDFLNCYFKYTSHKNKKTFESDIISKIKSFKNYKLIGTFFPVVKDCDEKIIATISYIAKDPTFFQGTYELTTPPESIQTYSFIIEVNKYLEHKRALLNLQKSLKLVQIYSDKLEKTENTNLNLINDNEKILSRISQMESEYKIMKNDNNIMKTNINNLTNENNAMKKIINTMETNINNLTNENNTMKTNINNLQNDNNFLKAKVNSLENENEKLKQNKTAMQSNIQNLIKNNNSLSQKVEDLTKRLEEIDLRDTIKLSFRYLYKVLKTKFPDEMNNVTKIWEQIAEVKKILSKPQFKRYDFISKFIDVISFDNLAQFNHITHDSTQKKRNFRSIEKYLQCRTAQDLEKVSEFFERLPFIDEFINLNLLFYTKPNIVDNEFEKLTSYSSIYNKVF